MLIKFVVSLKIRHRVTAMATLGSIHVQLSWTVLSGYQVGVDVKLEIFVAFYGQSTDVCVVFLPL